MSAEVKTQAPWEASLVASPRDKERVKAICEIASEFLRGRDYSGELVEDLMQHTYVLRYTGIQCVENPVDLFLLSNIVEHCRPYVRDCTVTWDQNTASHISIEIELWKDSVGMPDDHPIYTPVYPVPVDVNKKLDQSGFDMRQVPSEWSQIKPKVEAICAAMYTRGEDMRTPLVRLGVDPSSSEIMVDFKNTESITYSFLEYATASTGIVGLEALGKNWVLGFCVSDHGDFVFPTRTL